MKSPFKVTLSKNGNTFKMCYAVTPCKSTLVTKVTGNSIFSISPTHTIILPYTLLYTYIINIYKKCYKCYYYLHPIEYQIIERGNKKLNLLQMRYICYNTDEL